MSSWIVQRALREFGGNALWLAHRKELIGQSAATLEAIGLSVGVIAPGYPSLPGRQVQVASWQTLLKEEKRPEASVIVIDECHHAPAEEWGAVIHHYSGTRRIGATATPERGDGRPMSDVFDSLVVAANYSELIRECHLVPCRVFRPESELTDGVARDPLEAYEASPGKGLPGIGFAGSVKDCERYAEAFTTAGYKSAALYDGLGAKKRRKLVEAYRAGEYAFLWSIHILTEGFDVPHATVCILAGPCGTTGQYIQRVGRVLRPFPGKPFAILLDLRGVSWKHGLPTEDREYSLDGKAISSVGSLRVCPDCGFTYEPADHSSCPSCGSAPEPMLRAQPEAPKIYDLALAEVFEGQDTPSEAKRVEFDRLLRFAAMRGWGCTWVIKEYRKLFAVPPPSEWFAPQVKFNEFRRLQKVQQVKGAKPGFAAAVFKQTFGHWPERKWQWKTDAPWMQR